MQMATSLFQIQNANFGQNANLGSKREFREFDANFGVSKREFVLSLRNFQKSSSPAFFLSFTPIRVAGRVNISRPARFSWGLPIPTLLKAFFAVLPRRTLHCQFVLFFKLFKGTLTPQKSSLIFIMRSFSSQKIKTHFSSLKISDFFFSEIPKK